MKGRMEAHTRTARGSEVAIALLPSVSYISLTPRLSQIYTITPLSNLGIPKVEVSIMIAVDLKFSDSLDVTVYEVIPKFSNLNSFWERTSTAARKGIPSV